MWCLLLTTAYLFPYRAATNKVWDVCCLWMMVKTRLWQRPSCDILHATLKIKGEKGREEGKCTHFIPLHSPKISHYHMGSCFAGLWIRIKDFVSSVLRTFHHFFLLAWKCNLKYFTRESFGVWKIILLCASICIWNQRQSWFSSDSHKGILIFTRNRLCLHMYTYCTGLKKEWGILHYLRASLLLFVLTSLIPSIPCKAQRQKNVLYQKIPLAHS